MTTFAETYKILWHKENKRYVSSRLDQDGGYPDYTQDVRRAFKFQLGTDVDSYLTDHAVKIMLVTCEIID